MELLLNCYTSSPLSFFFFSSYDTWKMHLDSGCQHLGYDIWVNIHILFSDSKIFYFQDEQPLLFWMQLRLPRYTNRRDRLTSLACLKGLLYTSCNLLQEFWFSFVSKLPGKRSSLLPCSLLPCLVLTNETMLLQVLKLAA